MLPGAKNKRKLCDSFMWFIFNLQRRKICTALHNNLKWTFLLLVESLSEKKWANFPYLGWWPSVHCVNLTPLCGPLLKINCPITTTYWPQSFPQARPLMGPADPHMLCSLTKGRQYWYVGGLLCPMHAARNSNNVEMPGTIVMPGWEWEPVRVKMGSYSCYSVFLGPYCIKPRELMYSGSLTQPDQASGHVKSNLY
jgi:hypothetical protein